MALEIERKYLVNHEKWEKSERTDGQFYRQGYLLTDPNKTIRVRVTDTKSFLTIKGLSVGATRPEFEYEIPKDDAKQLLDMFAIADLTKIRYKVLFENKVWEVDEFLGENEGLIVAEIELLNENEVFALPNWVDKEVTGEQKYYNSNLSSNPFKNW
ncbi:Inorganic triphosphatase [Emticicia aquatica]|uniref:Inorganic triphosphatase n=1 Tax=Emticicia aquatica TaxID=1681835 RepID=A0ABN8EWQ2_9BACT|nr:CYTH domain-containing protein [Emticicia aquatica]CAH0996396.1 Inorganic triphosphatase [Emticicia aquatica]